MRRIGHSGKTARSLDRRRTAAHYTRMSWIEQNNGDAILTIRVVPRASKDEVAGVLGDALKIRLCAPPVEGKANEALARFLAKTLNVPPRCVEILHGETGRTKHVLVQGIRAAVAQERLLSATK